jgi:hypothetical protein
MEVDPHKSFDPLQGAAKPRSKKRVQKSSLNSFQGADHVADKGATVYSSSALQEVIRSCLDSMPEVRRQLVEVGRELAEDENYPSAEDLDELSRLAQRHINKERYEES